MSDVPVPPPPPSVQHVGGVGWHRVRVCTQRATGFVHALYCSELAYILYNKVQRGSFPTNASAWTGQTHWRACAAPSYYMSSRYRRLSTEFNCPVFDCIRNFAYYDVLHIDQSFCFALSGEPNLTYNRKLRMGPFQLIIIKLHYERLGPL